MIVRCVSCSAEFEHDPATNTGNGSLCPSCRSSGKAEIRVVVNEEVSIEDRVGGRRRGEKRKSEVSGRKRHSSELDFGHEQSRGTGRLVYKSREIDRENDRYHETVRDDETGEIIRDVAERLSDHQGHGSAKRKSGEEEDA